MSVNRFITIFACLALSVALYGWAMAVRVHDEGMKRAISTDGRYHLCGLVTEQGVTSHLDAYHARCAAKLDRRP